MVAISDTLIKFKINVEHARNKTTLRNITCIKSFLKTVLQQISHNSYLEVWKLFGINRNKKGMLYRK